MRAPLTGLLFLFLPAGFAVALTLAPGPIVERAKEAADNGRLQESLDLYKKLQQAGYDSAAISYNIGVVATELHDYGAAIQQLRRAARTYPLKAQYLVQLEQARTMSGATAETRVPIDLEISAGAIRMWALLAACIVVLVWRTQWRYLVAVLALAPWTVLGLSEYSLNRHKLNEQEVITQAEKTEAFASPTDGAQTVEVVSPGTELKVLDDRQSWIQVQLPTGRRGWVKENTGVLDPES